MMIPTRLNIPSTIMWKQLAQSQLYWHYQHIKRIAENATKMTEQLLKTLKPYLEYQQQMRRMMVSITTTTEQLFQEWQPYWEYQRQIYQIIDQVYRRVVYRRIASQYLQLIWEKPENGYSLLERAMVRGARLAYQAALDNEKLAVYVEDIEAILDYFQQRKHARKTDNVENLALEVERDVLKKIVTWTNNITEEKMAIMIGIIKGDEKASHQFVNGVGKLVLNILKFHLANTRRALVLSDLESSIDTDTEYIPREIITGVIAHNQCRDPYHFAKADDILEYIKQSSEFAYQITVHRYENYPYIPSIRNTAQALGMSKSSAHRHLKSARKRALERHKMWEAAERKIRNGTN
mgnify:CR=1 FL=1